MKSELLEGGKARSQLAYVAVIDVLDLYALDLRDEVGGQEGGEIGELARHGGRRCWFVCVCWCGAAVQECGTIDRGQATPRLAMLHSIGSGLSIPPHANRK